MTEKLGGMNTAIFGNGKPLLMLHGYLSNKESFFAQARYFEKYRTVIIPDLMGFGGQKMIYPYSLDDYKNDVNRLIDELKLEKVDLLAHSFGARVALKMLPENGKIDRLVLVGAAGMKPRFNLKKKLSEIKFKLAKRFKRSNLDGYGSADYRALDNIMKQSFVKIVNEHLDKRLCKIKNQTLIIEGENDFEAPMYMAKRLSRGLENSQLIVLKNAGHFAFIDSPRDFNLIVKEFLPL